MYYSLVVVSFVMALVISKSSNKWRKTECKYALEGIWRQMEVRTLFRNKKCSIAMADCNIIFYKLAVNTQLYDEGVVEAVKNYQREVQGTYVMEFACTTNFGNYRYTTIVDNYRIVVPSFLHLVAFFGAERIQYDQFPMMKLFYNITELKEFDADFGEYYENTPREYRSPWWKKPIPTASIPSTTRPPTCNPNCESNYNLNSKSKYN